MTKRELRKYKPGSDAYVVAHALRQRSRGRRGRKPAARFGSNCNPRIGLNEAKASLRDQDPQCGEYVGVTVQKVAFAATLLREPVETWHNATPVKALPFEATRVVWARYSVLYLRQVSLSELVSEMWSEVRFVNRERTLSWIEKIMPYVISPGHLTVPCNRILETFHDYGYTVNTNAGDDFDADDAFSHAGWIIGQFMAVLQNPLGSQMIPVLIDRWRKQFSSKVDVDDD